MADDKGREEEFYLLLTEGSELLQGGRVDEARVRFERALTMHPTHEQAQNLLGLSLFRLGQLDRARQIFAGLVHNNPIEPSLRLNLAMVHLKTGKIEDARVELERVLELNPDHPRAASYMGLVLEKKGELDRAAEYYERAGNKKRADEIRAYRPTATGTFPLPNLTQLVAQAMPTTIPPTSLPPSTIPPASIPPVHVPPEARGSATPRPISSITPMSAVTDGGPRPPGVEAAALTAAATSRLHRASEPPTQQAVETVRSASMGFTLDVTGNKGAAAAADGKTDKTDKTDKDKAGGAERAERTDKMVRTDAGASSSSSGEAAAIGAADALAELRVSDLLGLTPPTDAPKRLAASSKQDGALVFPIPDVGYVRTDLIVGMTGQFEIEAVHRRYRGKRTDSLFGGVDAPLAALLGKGVAFLWPGALETRLLALKNEELYLVETALVAFSQGLVWENGRLPSETDHDLDIVHLRGSGRLVLGTKSRLLVLPVRPDAPSTVHAHRLIGWNGQLVPFRAPLPGLPEGTRRVPVVRFEGTGMVLAI